jgi:hypothetical protein
VRKIEEGRAQDGELQIMDQIILAVQFMGSWKSVNPHVCWLNHTQVLCFQNISMIFRIFSADISITENVYQMVMLNLIDHVPF